MFNNNSHIIHTDKDDGPSRFLVDLKKAGEKRKAPPKSGLYEKFADFLSAADLGKIFDSKKRPKKGAPHGLTGGLAGVFDRVTSYRSGETPPFLASGWPRFAAGGKLRRLAFFPLLALGGKTLILAARFFYRICYEAGWLAVFALRLCVLTAAAVFKIALKSKNFLLWTFRLLALVAGVVSFLRTDPVKKIFSGRKGPAFWARAGTKRAGAAEAEAEEEAEARAADLVPAGARARRGGVRKMTIFAAILLVTILPFKTYSYYRQMQAAKNKALGVSAAALDEIMAGTGEAARHNFAAAGRNFSGAGEYFRQAQNEVKVISAVLRIIEPVAPSRDIKLAASAGAIFEAGRLSARLASVLSAALDGLSPGSAADAKRIIDNLDARLGEAEDIAGRLAPALAKIDAGALPAEYRDRFSLLASKADTLTACLAELSDIIRDLKIFLGFEYDGRYLLVFQNNAEMRASGGFVGSFALLDLSEGRIKNLKVPGGGSYDTEGGMYVRVAAPEPLWLVNPLWHFWDANWWPDWPSSAAKLAWFYEKSGGPTVDGVISFTPAVMENLLKVTGPVDMRRDYGAVIDAENFWEVTQTFAEQKPPGHPEYAPNPYLRNAAASTTMEYNPGKEPKKIIGDLAAAVSEKLSENFDKDVLLGIIGVLEKGLEEKHILAYFRDEEMQAKMASRGWEGGVRPTAWDYLMVVNTNIAGGKSDRVIREKIDLRSEVLSGGSIVNTLTVTRKHTAGKGDVFTGVRNNDWMRIYVPRGSRLLEAEGFGGPDKALFERPEPSWRKDPDVEMAGRGEMTDTKTGTLIYEESGKTVFANWSQVDPGGTAVIRLKYELPFSLIPDAPEDPLSLKERIGDFFSGGGKKVAPYALLAQKQPGSPGSEFTATLALPDDYGVVWRYPDDKAIGARGWKISADLSVDRYYAVLLGL